MGRNQRQRDFYRGTAFLEDDELTQLADEMKRSGAKWSGCLLLQGPFWLLAMLVAIICWLIYIANTPAQPSPIAQMAILGGFLLPPVYIATRKWVYRPYYSKPIIIGA